MSFSFGSSGQSTFGSAQNKPAAFGAPLSFSTPATTASTFGGFGSSFGTPASQQQPAFGSTFGQQSTTPAFGSTFGQTGTTAPTFGSNSSTFGTSFGTPATSAPAFGSTFGAPTTTTSLFGSMQTTKPSFFGTPASNTPSLFGTATTTTGSSLFGSSGTSSGGLFGTATTTQAPHLFGTATTSTPSLFGSISSTPSLFGTTSTPSTGGLFGTTPTTTSTGLFGSSTGFGLGLGTATTTSSGFNLFGSTTTTPSLFGGFGTTTTASGFTGLGTIGTSNWFGVKPITTTSSTITTTTTATGLTAPVAPPDKSQQVLASIYTINVFGDERDNVLKKWNMLQACWGTGKGYYNQNLPPVEYDDTNPFYRFKAIGYCVIPDADNSEGLVKLVFEKKYSELNSQRDVIIKGISGILGNKSNLTVVIDTVRARGDNQTEVILTVSEKGVTGLSRKIPATDLSGFLNQPMQKQQLTNVGVTDIVPCMQFSKAQLEHYLKTPPPGTEPALWQAAQAENPNPKKLMPTTLFGFSELKRRMLAQEHQVGLHRAFLRKVSKEIEELKRRHTASTAQIAEMKQKFLSLQHRTLRILVKQEATRKVGLALQPEEEMLRDRLEAMHAQLAIPNQYRGLLTELLSRVKLSGTINIHKENFRIDSAVVDDIKQFLKMQQNGITQLVNIINSDLRALKIMNEGLQEISKREQRI